nr:VIT1/CCC1 transporter family protein [Kingella kingae]
MTQSWTSAHAEPHYSSHNNWLRTSVLGANDGLISTASLLMGLASANASNQTILLTGLAALISDAVSMAAGEYVSVSSQTDIEQVDLQKESHELQHNPERELAELTAIYRSRGLDEDLEQQSRPFPNPARCLIRSRPRRNWFVGHIGC